MISEAAQLFCYFAVFLLTFYFEIEASDSDLLFEWACLRWDEDVKIILLGVLAILLVLDFSFEILYYLLAIYFVFAIATK